MKINFVFRTFNTNGGQRVIAHLAHGLQRRGHEVLAVAPPPRPPKISAGLRSLLRGRGWPPTRVACPTYLDDLGIPRHSFKRWRPIDDRDLPDADVVVASWWETAEWVAALSPRKGAKCHFIQNNEPGYTPEGERAARSWRLPTHKIVCSQWLADLLRDQYGEPHAAVVPNGISTELFDAPPRGKQPQPTVGLLYSTRWIKGCEVSLEAFTIASQQIPGLKLRAFGWQEPQPELPLPQGTEYTRMPPQDQLRDIYASCDVWLCGSRSEGFHLPPHEAMACRCPVVSTRVGGPMDLIQDGVNGYLVDVGDAGGLAERIVDVLAAPDPQWRRMSDAAYAKAREYTWDAATTLFENALKAVVTPRTPSASAVPAVAFSS